MKTAFMVLAVIAAAIGGMMMLANDLHEQGAAARAMARASITNVGESS
jgi:hypothetical protein